MDNEHPIDYLMMNNEHPIDHCDDEQRTPDGPLRCWLQTKKIPRWLSRRIRTTYNFRVKPDESVHGTRKGTTHSFRVKHDETVHDNKKSHSFKVKQDKTVQISLRRLRSLLCLCDFFQSLINSLVCWFCTGALGLILFHIALHSNTIKLFMALRRGL